jgi:hypothetical protein
MAGCAGFGYWVGKPGGLDFFPGAKPAPAAPAPAGGQTASGGAASAPLPDPDLGEAPPIDPALGYRVSGYRPQAIEPPFITRNEATDRTLELDRDGGLVYRLAETNQAVYQPVTTLQWAMGARTQYWVTGQQLWLDLARASALKVLAGRVESGGAYFFPYNYEWSSQEFGYDFQPPWYSGMAQGEALSVFTQMAQIFPDEPLWDEAARATFASLLQPPSADQPWVTDVVDGYLWFEEYAAADSFEVFNGHVFALFGVYEYALHSGDQRAFDLFDAGATTALHAMATARRPGQTSLYCVEPERCVDAGWQNGSYQKIHIAQLEMLQALTGDDRFADWAAALASDTPGQGPWRVAAYWPKPG